MKFDLRDYIVTVPNVVPNDLCDEIVNYYSQTLEWEDTYVRNGIDRNIRSAQSILISTEKVISKDPSIRTALDQELFKSASVAIRAYNELYPPSLIEEDSGYQLLRYKTGEFYTQHTDSFKDAPRAVSCSFALNDGYEGGEFSFFDRQLVTKPFKGSALMFPSNFMYPHEILPVTQGTRYSIITWFI